MPELVRPSVRYRDSFLEAMNDFIAEGRGTPTDESALGRDLLWYASTWHEPDGFAAYLLHLRTQGDPCVEPPPNFVWQTTWWFVEGLTYLGSIRVRHALNDWLRDSGGHIGYDIAPAHRRKGYGTAMLGRALYRAAHLGLDPVLITCDPDNVASRRVIEANGGRLEDERDGLLRFWVRTTADLDVYAEA